MKNHHHFEKAVSSVYGYFFLVFPLKQLRNGKNLKTGVGGGAQLAFRLGVEDQCKATVPPS